MKDCTTLDAPTRAEAEAELLRNPDAHADEFSYTGSETAVIGIQPEEGVS